MTFLCKIDYKFGYMVHIYHILLQALQTTFYLDICSILGSVFSSFLS